VTVQQVERFVAPGRLVSVLFGEGLEHLRSAAGPDDVDGNVIEAVAFRIDQPPPVADLLGAEESRRIGPLRSPPAVAGQAD